MPTPCFFLEPTTRHERSLRRFTYSGDWPCPANVAHYNGEDHNGGHEAMAPLDVVDERSCGLPNDNDHACWCREGVPPRVNISKNCRSCAAGAGSIATGNYHGFLVDGVFTDG